MRRALACVALLWFFYRFDPVLNSLTVDGGHARQETCEAHAAQHGYLTRLISSRVVLGERGAPIGRWQIACFDGPDTLALNARPAQSVTVNTR